MEKLIVNPLLKDSVFSLHYTYTEFFKSRFPPFLFLLVLKLG